MAATFNPALTDQVSQVRFLLGDTTPATAEVQDESISYFLGAGKTVTATAVSCAWSIAAKYASLADTAVDDQLTRYSHVHKAWVEVAKRLEADAGNSFPGPAATAVPAFSSVMVGGLGDCRGPLDDCCTGYPYTGGYIRP